MADDPTPRELLIQLQAAVAQIDALAARLDGLTQTLASTYVPRGEYREARKGDDRRFGDIEEDIKAQVGFRRQVAAGAIVGLLLIAANIFVALTRLPGSGS